MILPFFVFFGSALAVLVGPSTAGSALAVAVPIGSWKKNKEYERNMRLGINSEFEKFKAEQSMLADAFEFFQFSPEDLPPSMHWMLAQSWLLTDTELTRLFAMVRRQMLDAQEGPYAEAVTRLCSDHNISYNEMWAQMILLSCKMGYRKNTYPACYEELIWFSNNRLADPTIQKKFAALGQNLPSSR